VKRREFITAVGSAVAVWPITAQAQRTLKTARIGYLAFRSPMSADDSFFQGLRHFGWNEGQNIFVERRFAAGSIDQLKSSAAELAHLQVDVIVAAASAATQAAKDATASIPIVFVNAGDPVGQGFIQSLSHPGGNLTGIAFDASPDITAKQAQLIIEAVPKASRLAVLWNPTNPAMHSYFNALKTAAPALRVELQSLEVQEPNELERAFDAMTRERADGLLVLSDSFTTFHRARLAELAAGHRLPALYGHRQYIEAGGLMSYGPSISDAYRQGALTSSMRFSRAPTQPIYQPSSRPSSSWSSTSKPRKRSASRFPSPSSPVPTR
jgi:ABC-type uncharacterized transport system substrate-binding protein